MCGIVGYVDYSNINQLDILDKMMLTLKHRGPDSSERWVKQFNNMLSVGLGHLRLSILDLSENGKQPMQYENLVIVFNGEIYNFKELKKELVSLGYSFFSNSDTEVFLKAFHHWNTECVNHFTGMFAATIFDIQDQKLYLIRDRTGVKPLFWYKNNGLFMFSSELKAFHKHPGFKKEINIDALALFFKYGYIPQPHSIFKNTFKLEAGHILIYDLKSCIIKDKTYWDVEFFYNQPKLDISESEAIEETERILTSSFNYRMVSDVPVGVFLSGGYDSTAVACLLQNSISSRLKTFTIGFDDEKYNEALHAKEVAKRLNTDHTEFFCKEKELLEILPLLPNIYDEPFGDISTIPTILLSKIAREQVKVALSADGGDETFGGYNKYTRIGRRKALIEKLPKALLPLLSRLLKNKHLINVITQIGMYNAKERISSWSENITTNEKLIISNSTHFLINDLNKLFKKDYNKSETCFDSSIDQDWLTNIMAIDYKTYLPDDILVKIDRATMSVSLEGREPMLDNKIIEFAARLPNQLKIFNGNKKYILKQIVHKYLPKEIMERPKMGFGVPLTNWLNTYLKDYLHYYLDSERIEQEDILSGRYVKEITNNFLVKKYSPYRIWLLLVFEMWYEKWMK